VAVKNRVVGAAAVSAATVVILAGVGACWAESAPAAAVAVVTAWTKRRRCIVLRYRGVAGARYIDANDAERLDWRGIGGGAGRSSVDGVAASVAGGYT
jgi:hypothetical protein